MAAPAAAFLTNGQLHGLIVRLLLLLLLRLCCYNVQRKNGITAGIKTMSILYW
jgi:hypothetical protein